MAPVAERHLSVSEAFDAWRRDPAFSAHGLRAVREAAFDRFVTAGLPTTRHEEWRFTNVAPIGTVAFQRAPEEAPGRAALQPFLFDRAIPLQLVVVNGRISTPLSTLSALPAGVTIGGLDQAGGDLGGVAADRPGAFVPLNTAFFEDIVVIDIQPRTRLQDALHVLFVTAGSGPMIVAPRLIIRAGERSQVTVVESYADRGGGPVLTTAVTDVRVGPGAHVDHVKLQRQAPSAFHLGSMFVHADRGAVFASHSITLGGRIARNDVVAVLEGEGAECTLNGLYVAGGESLVDNHTTIDHAEPHCPSHEVYKGILAGRARAVFNGKIIVRPDAQKTNAKQTNKALLLSDEAQINTKPQLEIFADDVKCTHGAAIGQLDEDALFYLRARGIDIARARNMLIHAFAGDVLEGVGVSAVRDAAMHVVDGMLAIG
jgi:Fe-S cluster assembly protein SufD